MSECLNNMCINSKKTIRLYEKSLNQTQFKCNNLHFNANTTLNIKNRRSLIIKASSSMELTSSNLSSNSGTFFLSKNELRDVLRLASSKSTSNFLNRFKERHVNPNENSFTTNEIEQLRTRFRLAIRKLCVILRLCSEVRKNSVLKLNREVSIYKFLHEKNENIELAFDKSQFCKLKEQNLPEYVKRILRMRMSERSDEQLRYAIASITQAVPEFEDYPSNLQKLIIKYSTYEEYDSERVILREGDPPMHFYYVLSGTLMATVLTQDSFTGEHVNRTVTFLKRGDMFGELALINRTKRNASIISHTKISILSIHKSYFFSVLTPFSNPKEKFEFLADKVPLLLNCGYPVHKFKHFSDGALNAIYYRKGIIINKTSRHNAYDQHDNKYNNENDDDEYIYIIKTGSCKVVKSICVSNNERIKYKREKAKRQLSFLKIEELNKRFAKGLTMFHTRKFNFNKEIEKLDAFEKSVYEHTDEIYLEIECLGEGDIHGIRDIIFPEQKSQQKVYLVSNGVGCIRINKKSFLRYLDEDMRDRMRSYLVPYPTSNDLIKKYLDSFNWILYKKDSFNETCDSIMLLSAKRC